MKQHLIKKRTGEKNIFTGNLNGRIQNSRSLIFLFLLLICVPNCFSQALDLWVVRINNGSIEEKRDALFQLRNLQNAEASRLAVPGLKDANEIVRVTAVYSVIYLPPDEAYGVLLPLLSDKSRFVRKETASALGKIQDKSAVPALLETLERDRESEVRTAAALALGEIGDVSAIDGLLRILQKKPKGKEDFLRRTTARSIGQIAQFQQVKKNYVVTPESILPEKYDTFVNLSYSNLAEQFRQFRQAIPVLLTVLQNQKESDDVRREAAFSLGTFGEKAVFPVLQSGLSSKDYYLAEICKEALQKISTVLPAPK